jgi:hypothetical protein
VVNVSPEVLSFVFDASHCKSNGFLLVGTFLMLNRKFKSNENLVSRQRSF